MNSGDGEHQTRSGESPPLPLQAIGVSKSYGELRAVINLDLRVCAGDIYCLLGPNGAGKTTTINLFLNFTRPDTGTLRIGGLDVTVHPLRTKDRIAYVPEQVMLYRSLTGLENLRYFTALSGNPRLRKDELSGFLERAGLAAEAANRRVGTYSKGMRQKVGIAMAMAKGADALLLDEPTSGLDPKASNEFSALLVQLANTGVGILMATHDLFRARETGTRVGIMRHGQLVTELSTQSLGHADLEQIYLQHMHD